MTSPWKTKKLSVIKIAAAFTPWLISMYLLYWLEYGGIWTYETPHRGKTAVLILVAGMSLSFLVRSFFVRREKTS